MNSNVLLELPRISSCLLCVFVPRIQARWRKSCSETLSESEERNSGTWGWAPIGSWKRLCELLVSGVASLCEVLRKVPVNGDCEIPLEGSCSEKRSETAKLVSGELLLAGAAGVSIPAST